MYAGMGDPCHCGCPYLYVSPGIASSLVFLLVFPMLFLSILIHMCIFKPELDVFSFGSVRRHEKRYDPFMPECEPSDPIYIL
jgi:hypothetical protein